MIESIESDDAQFVSVLNDERIEEIRQIARVTVNDDRMGKRFTWNVDKNRLADYSMSLRCPIQK